MCAKGFKPTGRGCAQVASCAQRLLEHSLLTELQGVVGRTLQGVDMFTPTQLAGILGHSTCLPDAHQETSEAQVPVLLMQYCPLLFSFFDCCLGVLQSCCWDGSSRNRAALNQAMMLLGVVWKY